MAGPARSLVSPVPEHATPVAPVWRVVLCCVVCGSIRRLFDPRALPRRGGGPVLTVEMIIAGLTDAVGFLAAGCVAEGSQGDHQGNRGVPGRYGRCHRREGDRLDSRAPLFLHA